jgi:hypothetical protein
MNLTIRTASEPLEISQLRAVLNEQHYLIITLCHLRTGAPLAMATYSGAKDDCELPVGQALLKQAAEVLANAVVTTDALHSQKKRL